MLGCDVYIMHQNKMELLLMLMLHLVNNDHPSLQQAEQSQCVHDVRHQQLLSVLLDRFQLPQRDECLSPNIHLGRH